MARKRTKGKATKNVARKKVTKTASAKRRRGKAAKKPRKPASKDIPSEPRGPQDCRVARSRGPPPRLVAVSLLDTLIPNRISVARAPPPRVTPNIIGGRSFSSSTARDRQAIPRRPGNGARSQGPPRPRAGAATLI